MRAGISSDTPGGRSRLASFDQDRGSPCGCHSRLGRVRQGRQEVDSSSSSGARLDDPRLRLAERRRPEGRHRVRRRRPGRPLVQRRGSAGHEEGRRATSGPPASRARRSSDEPESAREDRLRQLADAGFNPIIGVGFAYSDVGQRGRADDYPDISFGVVDGFDPTPNKDGSSNDPNVAYLGFAENEGSFLVGVAAALRRPRPTTSASSAASTST